MTAPAATPHAPAATPHVPAVTSDPQVMLGKPCVAGTRITVELILERLGYGATVGQIADDYPHLCREQVEAAVEFARDSMWLQFAVARAAREACRDPRAVGEALRPLLPEDHERLPEARAWLRIVAAALADLADAGENGPLFEDDAGTGDGAGRSRRRRSAKRIRRLATQHRSRNGRGRTAAGGTASSRPNSRGRSRRNAGMRCAADDALHRR